MAFENDHNIDATDRPGKSGYFVGIMTRQKDDVTPLDLNDMNNIKNQGAHFLDCITGRCYSDGESLPYFDKNKMTPGAIIDILLDK